MAKVAGPGAGKTPELPPGEGPKVSSELAKNVGKVEDIKKIVCNLNSAGVSLEAKEYTTGAVNTTEAKKTTGVARGNMLPFNPYRLI